MRGEYGRRTSGGSSIARTRVQNAKKPRSAFAPRGSLSNPLYFRPLSEPVRPSRPSDRYLQAGSPSPADVTIGFVVFTPMPQLKLAICVCVTVAVQ